MPPPRGDVVRLLPRVHGGGSPGEQDWTERGRVGGNPASQVQGPLGTRSQDQYHTKVGRDSGQLLDRRVKALPLRAGFGEKGSGLHNLHGEEEFW